MMNVSTNHFMDICKAIYSVSKEYLFRNKIILKDFSRSTNRNCVNLHWWKMAYNQVNIGDYLSEVIVEYMKRRNNIQNDNSFDGRTRHLYAVGSIVNSGYQDATIWGSGCLESKLFFWRWIRKLDVRCVRGPLTRETLIKNGYKCPEVYGDPAVLMPLIYSPKSTEKICDYLVIKHHSNSNVIEFSNCKFVSTVTNDFKGFIDVITNAKMIISSSLHGIILAESYGIPAIWLKDSSVDEFKYYDWYYSTGRFNITPSLTIEDARQKSPPDLPDLQNLRKSLIDSFPYELWK